jgi:hypothetical protein
MRRLGEDLWIVWGASKGLPGEISALTAVLLAIVRPTVEVKLIMVVGGLRKGRAIMWVTLYRLPEQVEGVRKPVSLPGSDVRESTQVQIVSGEIAGPTLV